MSTMQERANKLHWATQGVNATVKRKLFLDAFIEIHNMAIEDAAKADISEIADGNLLERKITAIRRLFIEVPEE